MATIFDVIENFWGKDPLPKINRADKITLSRFANEVNRFYDSYTPPPPNEGEFRTYYGGLVAVNFSLAGKQRILLNNLLYAHSTIIPDPIGRWYFDRYEELTKTPAAEYFGGQAVADQSEWMGWIFNSHRAFRWDLTASREVLRYYVLNLLTLRPLVEANIIVLISQAHMLLRESTAIVEASLEDAASLEFQVACDDIADEQIPLWDNVRGGIMTPSRQLDKPDPKTISWAQAKEAAYYIRKNLKIASSAGGYYVPENETDSHLLQRIVIRSGQKLGYTEWETQVSRAVQELVVPSLENLSPLEIIAVRKDESAFNEFRLWLSRRLLSASVENARASIQITSQEIEAEIQKLRSQLGNSGVIKQFVRENGLKIAVQTLVGMATSLTVGSPMLGAAAGALSGVVSGMFMRDRKSGVLTQLARMNRTANDSNLDKKGPPPSFPRVLSLPFFGEMRLGQSGKQLYTTQHLRQIVMQAMMPNRTGNPYRALAPKRAKSLQAKQN